MSDIVLKVENLSKQYRLGEIGTGTISHDLNRWWARIRGKDDPFSKIGQVNDRTKKSESDFVWALKDINFEVKKGAVLGIIGKNGAGKSTLLKLISRITAPTTGFVKAKGRIASLLEVGTGMHPEMTARENIYLNGAIMGMTKKEIKRKFDEIIDFAGCTMYVDTPVKRFSSGMRVRLGFAVAAFLEPEILIVDEVLAVGDVEFQKKAVGKMKDVSSSDGRTVLFVSHNMASVRALCKDTIVLKNGKVDFVGPTQDAIMHYQEINSLQLDIHKEWKEEEAPGIEKMKLLSVKAEPLEGADFEVASGIKVSYRLRNKIENASLGTTIEITNQSNILVFHTGVVFTPNKDSKDGYYDIEFNIPPNLLNQGIYTLNVQVGQDQRILLFKEKNIIQVVVDDSPVNGIIQPKPGVIKPILDSNITFKPHL